MTYEDLVKNTSKTIKVKKYVSCTSCKGSGAKDTASIQNCSTCNGSGQVRTTRQTFMGAMQTVSTCPTCNGSGSKILNKCGSCNGEGRAFAEETIEIEIPAGVQEGMQLSVSGKGNAGEQGGPSGDLLVLIEEEKHADLKREGDNVTYELHISFPDAVLGTEIEVPIIGGRAKIKIPPGTHSGKIFSLKGKGFPNINNSYSKGDQLIHLNVWTPQELSSEEKNLLEKLKASKNFIPGKVKDHKSIFDKLRDVFN
jgi:molecular chaperone DnaJ